MKNTIINLYNDYLMRRVTKDLLSQKILEHLISEHKTNSKKTTPIVEKLINHSLELKKVGLFFTDVMLAENIEKCLINGELS